MKHGERARTEEREHLKLALATFALQLDAFEMRTQGILLGVGQPNNPVARLSGGRGPGEDHAVDRQ